MVGPHPIRGCLRAAVGRRRHHRRRRGVADGAGVVEEEVGAAVEVLEAVDEGSIRGEDVVCLGEVEEALHELGEGGDLHAKVTRTSDWTTTS